MANSQSAECTLAKKARFLSMSSWEDHQEMIDDQYLMESIEEDQKLEAGESEIDDDESEEP